MSRALENKVAVITGGASGIGLGIANRFVTEGASVVVTGRRRAQLNAAADTIGERITTVEADVTNLLDLDRLYGVVEQRHGQLDIVVANAGYAEYAPLGDIGEAHYDRHFQTNVKGVLFTVQKALPLMADGGSIIVVGSISSFVGAPAFSVYGATKAAVRALVRSWIIDLKGSGIRANVLAPGPVETGALVGLVDPGERQAFLDMFVEQIPMGRLGEPDDMAKAAVFLASDSASFINGIELCVDGGLSQI